MKFLFKKIYIILFIFAFFLLNLEAFAKDIKIQYSRENVSNYFLGIISAKQDYNNKAFDYLKKVKSIRNKHSKYNVEFIRTLVLLEQFEKAQNFSRSVWNKNDYIFEADLLLGLDYFLKNDYKNAEKHFLRLNKISEYNLFFEDFIGNILIAWMKAETDNIQESFSFLKKIPNAYLHLTKTQETLLQCYFNTAETEKSFQDLINSSEYNFSRYNFFLINYLLSENKSQEAKKIIKKSREKHSSNLLLKQTENFFLNNKVDKIKNFFSCKNPKDSIAEFFYIIANLYSSEKDYKLSNFYLKISLLLNEKFSPNKALLAENLYYQEKNKLSKNTYLVVKEIGPVYSWFASKSIASILSDEKGKKYSVKSLENEFNLLKKLNYEHYFELANFYKDNEYYKESIKYYSLTLEMLENGHFLIPKILDRRGTSYERIGEWDKAEKDLTESLKILPDQPHVLNYLAYSWIDKGINLEKGLLMLKKANKLRENDGYIIDSLGWAYYSMKNYKEAESFLQRAVELMPSDPVINDHYADALWMLKKNIQARYVWNYVLKLNETEQKLKDSINKKIIFGISEKL